MKKDHILDLKSALSYQLREAPYDKDATDETTLVIEHLAALTRDYDIGIYSRSEIKQHFKLHAPEFDFMRWLQKWADEGVYDLPDI